MVIQILLWLTLDVQTSNRFTKPEIRSESSARHIYLLPRFPLCIRTFQYLSTMLVLALFRLLVYCYIVILLLLFLYIKVFVMSIEYTFLHKGLARISTEIDLCEVRLEPAHCITMPVLN